jgi:hypothetical protein
MKKYFSELTIVIVIIIGTILLNITPFIYRTINTPPGKSFTGAQFYTLDYNIYLGHFKEGANGIWLVHDKHTSEPQKGFLLRREYILWGFLTGKLLGFPIVLVYHSSRIVGGIAVLLLFYILLKQLFPDKKEESQTIYFPNAKHKRLLGLLLGTVVAGFPKYYIDQNTGKQVIDLFLFWFTESDASARYAPLFHYLIGYGILLAIFILFIKFVKKEVSFRKSFLIAVILGLLAPLIHPATFITIYLSFAIYLTIRFLITALKSIFKGLRKKELRDFFMECRWIIGFVLVTLPIVPFLNSQVNTFPWNEIAKWDKATQTPIEFTEYIFAIGPTFFLGILGVILLTIQQLIRFFKNSENKEIGLQNKSFLLLLSFPSATFLLVFFLWPYLLDINRVRFMQVPIFIPFAIFSVVTIEKIINVISIPIQKVMKGNHVYQIKFSGFMTILCILIYITFPAYRHGIIRDVNMFPVGDMLIYPDKKWVDAMNWLNQNTRHDSVVLASFHASGLIPGLAGNTSYSGHPWSTVNYPQKETLLNKFFRNLMTNQEATQFLKEGNIQYIFFGYQEKSLGLKPENYPFLQKIFDNQSVQIYKINLN